MLLAIGGVSTGAQPPSLLTEADHKDAACILALSAAAEQIANNQEMPVELVQASATYFVGKIKARHPERKLASLLTPDYVESLEVSLPATLARCGVELQEAGADMEATGQALIESGKD